MRGAHPLLHINIPCLHIYHFPHTLIHYNFIFLFCKGPPLRFPFIFDSFTISLVLPRQPVPPTHPPPAWRQSDNPDSRTSSTMSKQLLRKCPECSVEFSKVLSTALAATFSGRNSSLIIGLLDKCCMKGSLYFTFLSKTLGVTPVLNRWL